MGLKNISKEALIYLLPLSNNSFLKSANLAFLGKASANAFLNSSKFLLMSSAENLYSFGRSDNFL